MWVLNDQHCFHYKCHCLMINPNELTILLFFMIFHEFKLYLQFMDTFRIISDIAKED